MTTTRVCPQCEAPLPQGVADWLCPKCLLGQAAGPAPAISQPTSHSSRATPHANSILHYFGDYELLHEISRGGMGVVYKARQVSLNRVVAVKMLQFGKLAGGDFVKRFRIEAEAVASLQHPNIVAIHEVGEHEGQPYFSMEYVEGANLAELVREKPLPAKRAAAYLKTVAQAIHYAHGRGILHRDLKPSNILLDTNDQPRITDFGLAKRLVGTGSTPSESHSENESDAVERVPTADLTVTGQVLGTPGFMSPEQAGGKRGVAGPANDVYSLGALLYFLLTARAPFAADSLEETLRQVHESEPVSPRLLSASIPRDLETVCLKCLSKEPSRRYATAQELAEELDHFLRNEPIHARPAGRLEKSWRWCRRKPALAVASVAVFLLLLTVAIGASTAVVRINKERQRAQTGELAARHQAYVSDIILAHQSLKLNNRDKAVRLLERHRPLPDQADLRGWEWRYLWQLTRSSALVALTNRQSFGFSVGFSPDGTRLAVGWIDGCVDLWDVPARRLIRQLTKQPQSFGAHVAFAPTRNLLAATSGHQLVTLYDFDSDRESTIWHAPDHGAWEVRRLAFSQDGSKLLVYAGSSYENPQLGDAAWVVDVNTAKEESRHPAPYSNTRHFGGAQISPDNRRLYLAQSDSANYRYSIECVELSKGEKLWETETQQDFGLTALALSPDGKFLASGSGFSDNAVRIWDAMNGHLVVRLDGHSGWVSDLTFTHDGRFLISAAMDQSVRIWDVSDWSEAQVLRGHSDEVHSVASSATAHFFASTGKDGNILLWDADSKLTKEGYCNLSERFGANEVQPLDSSRVIILPSDGPPELVDLRDTSLTTPLQDFGSSSNCLGCFGSLVCQWNGINQIRLRELKDANWTDRGTVTLKSGTRPVGLAFNAARQFIAWTEDPASTSVWMANLSAPNSHIECKSDVPGLIPSRFSEDGNYLAASINRGPLRAWRTETGAEVASVSEHVADYAFAAGGRMLVVASYSGEKNMISFYDLTHPDRSPRRVREKHQAQAVAVSPDGRMVAISTLSGQIRLFDAFRGEWIADLDGHLYAVFGIEFSPDGRRLLSTSGSREAIRVWDIISFQEILTLPGTGSILRTARWTGDGDIILAGRPWQAWRAPSWVEIEKAKVQNPQEGSSRKHRDVDRFHERLQSPDR